MNLWSAIVAIVFICCLSEVMRSYFKSGNRLGKERDVLHQRMDDLEAELGTRIATLERIVTDQRSDLHRQFEDLEKSA